MVTRVTEGGPVPGIWDHRDGRNATRSRREGRNAVDSLSPTSDHPESFRTQSSQHLITIPRQASVGWTVGGSHARGAEALGQSRRT